MSARINPAGKSAHSTPVNKASQPALSQNAQKNGSQPEARSSYSFQDSRHVVKGGGMAAVSLELTIEEESAENIELLGFQQGDNLLLEGLGSVHGTALITALTKDRLELQIKLTVPQMSRRAAAIVFERLTKIPYLLDTDGQASLTGCITKDGKGGYQYSLSDGNNKNKLLKADSMNLRIDNFSARNSTHQLQTYIVESGNTISFAIEQAPGQEPTGKIKVSLAPGMGDFEVSRQQNP